jgi:hypothetical protein
VVGKHLDSFRRKCEELAQIVNNLTSVNAGESGNVCEALYKVSYRIARCAEEHMIGENVVKTCVKYISCVFGGKHLEVIESVPSSNSAV